MNESPSSSKVIPLYTKTDYLCHVSVYVNTNYRLHHQFLTKRPPFHIRYVLAGIINDAAITHFWFLHFPVLCFRGYSYARKEKEKSKSTGRAQDTTPLLLQHMGVLVHHKGRVWCWILLGRSVLVCRALDTTHQCSQGLQFNLMGMKSLQLSVINIGSMVRKLLSHTLWKRPRGLILEVTRVSLSWLETKKMYSPGREAILPTVKFGLATKNFPLKNLFVPCSQSKLVLHVHS